MHGAVVGTLLCALTWTLGAGAAETSSAPAEPTAKAGTEIALNVKVMKVSLSKMRDAGIDFTFTAMTEGGKQANRQGFDSLLLFLKRNNLVRTEIEPTLVTAGGRPAYFHSGPTVAGRKIGTQLHLTPTLSGEGRIHCKLRTITTEVDPTVSVRKRRTMIPGFKTAEMDLEFDVDPGNAWVCGGPIDSAVDPKTRDIVETQMIYVVTPERVAPAEK